MAKAKRGRSTIADDHIGGRIRERRIMLGLTQQQLAEMIGVTYQQAHKYERGINRVSAGRLFEIARALSVPITYFYEDIGEEGPPQITLHQRMRAPCASRSVLIISAGGCSGPNGNLLQNSTCVPNSTTLFGGIWKYSHATALRVITPYPQNLGMNRLKTVPMLATHAALSACRKKSGGAPRRRSALTVSRRHQALSRASSFGRLQAGNRCHQ